MTTEKFHCKQACDDPRHCTTRQQKQSAMYRLQDALQNQITLGREILATRWNPTEDMKSRYAMLLGEHDMARQALEAVSGDCDGPVFVPTIR